MHRILPLLLLVLVGGLAAVEPAQFRHAASTIGPSVVDVRVVSTIKLAIMGQNRTLDHEGSAIGVVVDASGLVAVMGAELDPAAVLNAVLGGNPMIKLEAEVKEVVIRLADGSEIAADVAVRDADLGLALLRPREASAGLVAPAATGAMPQLGDPVLVLGRAPRHAAAALLVGESRIAGVVGGPQPYAIVGGAGLSGGAVCDADGRLVGVLSTKDAPQRPDAPANAPMDPLAGLTASLDAKTRVPVPIVRGLDAVRRLVEQAK